MSWNGVQSDAFPVPRRFRQGGVISPIPFALFELEQSGVGCFWEDLFVGALVTHLEMMLLGGMAIVALEREGFLTICISFLGSMNMQTVLSLAPLTLENCEW